MSSIPASYTPLESLLLFQALRSTHSTNGVAVEPGAFVRIANELKSVPLVHNDPAYDPKRLSADALRQLYLDLLKEEARRDLESQFVDTSLTLNGDGSPNRSRKRKAPSPKLPTVEEAARHTHLIPRLISRLYLRYRENAIRNIREQERRYNDLQHGSGEETIIAGPNNSRERASLVEQPVDDHGENLALRRQTDTNGPELASTFVGPAVNRVQQGSATQQDGVSQSQQTSLPASRRQTTLQPTPPTLQPIQPALTAPHMAVNPGSEATRLAANQSYVSGSSNVAAQPNVHISQSHPAQTRAQSSQHLSTASTQLNESKYSPAHQPQLQAASAHPAQHRPQHAAASQDTNVPGVAAQRFAQTQQAYQGQLQSVHTTQDAQVKGQQRYPAGQISSPGQHQQVSTAPSTGLRTLAAQPSQRSMSEVLAALATPPRLSRQPVWKSEKGPATERIETPGSPKRPDVEPLSPSLARAPSPVRQESASRPRQSTRNLRKREESLTASTTTRNTRSVSIESSNNASVGEDGHSARRHLKYEQSTPVAVNEDSESASHVMPRTRRSTLQTNSRASSYNHRKRQASTELNRYDGEQIGPAPVPSTKIIATRNFAKMSSVIMNDIVSHKHGSRFAQPVRDRDADGYSSFIKRPQDLKSIRSAITYGARAISAATANATDSPAPGPPTPSSASKNAEATVELERSIDLIPPKAIVNGAQLEKEIMRMFANAVMFNPGEDGMVADAREMFEDVDAKITQWRGAERESGSASAISGGNDGEEEGGRSKRRKL